MRTNLTDTKQNCRQLVFTLDDAMELTPGCVWMKQTQVLGEGEDGTVYLVCKECEQSGERQCQFSVKHIQRTSNREAFRTKVVREVTMHKRASGMGLAPEIMDAFICGDDAFIVMEKKDYNIVDYLQKLLRATRDLPKVLRLLDQLRHSTMSLVRQLHSNKLIHGDPHLKNFMVDVDANDPARWFNLQAIDLSKAEPQSSAAEADQEEPIIEVSMSFDKLKRELTEMEQRLQEETEENRPIPTAPRKQRPNTAIRSPAATRRPLFGDDEDESVSATPMKSSKLSFEDTPRNSSKKALFIDEPEEPEPNRALSWGDSDHEEPDEEKEETPQTPRKNLFGGWDDSDEEETNGRYHPYRWEDTEDQPYEEMIDPDYYIDQDYDPDEEWIQQIPDQ